MSKRTIDGEYKPPRKIWPDTTAKEDTQKDMAHVIILLEELKDSIDLLLSMQYEVQQTDSTDEGES